MGGLFGSLELNSLVLSPRTPSPTASVRSNTSEKSAQVKINNKVIYVTPDLQKYVSDGADHIRASYNNGLYLKKELILDKELLIEFLNHAKLYWHAWLAKQPEKTSASDRIENAFINNKNLSKEESEWVEDTIADYKRMVKATVSQNTPRPITPPPVNY
jgi:hypothetical protein